MENIFVMNGIKKSATKSEPGEFRTSREAAYFLTLSKSSALSISHDHGTIVRECTKVVSPKGSHLELRQDEDHLPLTLKLNRHSQNLPSEI